MVWPDRRKVTRRVGDVTGAVGNGVPVREEVLTPTVRSNTVTISGTLHTNQL